MRAATVAVALLAFSLTPDRVRADPCCLAQVCVDLLPADCLAQGGLAGSCAPGQPCGAVSCATCLMRPVADLRLVKAGPDLALAWSADPSADSYTTRWVTKKDFVRRACMDAYANGVAGGGPSTVPAVVDPGAIAGSARTLRYYCTRPSCSARRAEGACCGATGSCTGCMSEAACVASGGHYGGDESRCEESDCSLLLRCLGGGSVIHLDGDPRDSVHPGMQTITQALFEPRLSPTTLPSRVRIDATPTDPGQGLFWYLRFSVRELGRPLGLGFHRDARHEANPPPGVPGLAVSGDGRGCTTLAGYFQVFDLVVEGTELRSFSATFEQYCSIVGPGLRGCVHYEP